MSDRKPIVVKEPFQLDGETVCRIRCPACRYEGLIDDDQYHGRVSIVCDCGYHETHDLSGGKP